MVLTDYHMHSLCSPDGCEPLSQLAQAAVDRGFTHICLTDHCDLLDGYGRVERGFTWAPIEAQLADARPKFAGRLDIRMGLELGEAWEDPAYVKGLLDRPGLDFVIGSVHNRNSRLGGGDLYYENYTNEDICYTLLDDYFSNMEALSRMDCYDVLAHIIYPLRYMNQRDGNHVSIERYEPNLRRIFKHVLDQGKGIEMNTCRGLNIEDWGWTLALYRDCGGRWITLGSDAHQSRDVGKGIQQAVAFAKGMGLEQTALFQGRKPEFVAL